MSSSHRKTRAVRYSGRQRDKAKERGPGQEPNTELTLQDREMPRVTIETIDRVGDVFAQDPDTFVAESLSILAERDPALRTTLLAATGALGKEAGTHILIGGLAIWRMLDATDPDLPPSIFNPLQTAIPPLPWQREMENPHLMRLISEMRTYGEIGTWKAMGAMTVYEQKREALNRPVISV